ncbi:hypothetical protein SDC9_145363 [bioreactor metagenome]|uniref:Uncharacterized protein n=1 Tax=bioreactor metagenome TaxID=1076179 RepID=A0A645E8S3_9ZZZZ
MLGFAPAGVARHRSRRRHSRADRNWRTTHVRRPPRQRSVRLHPDDGRVLRNSYRRPHRRLRLFSSRYLSICGVSLFFKAGGEASARSAPLRPEIHQDDVAARRRLAQRRLTDLAYAHASELYPWGYFLPNVRSWSVQEGFVPETGRSFEGTSHQRPPIAPRTDAGLTTRYRSGRANSGQRLSPVG